MTTPQSTPEGRAEHWEARWRGACERARDAAAEVDRLRAQVAHQGACITALGDQLADMERDRDRYAAAVRRVRELATNMRDWCSPHGIATDYADRIFEALDGPAAPGEKPQGDEPERYPAQIGVFCDDCGRGVVHDYVVSDAMDQAERFEVARAHLRTAEGWSCTDDADLCPQCAPTSA